MKMLAKIVLVLGVISIGSATACELKDKWAKSCRDPKMIKMDDAIKNAIVNIHNELRNKIALGQVKNYKEAANMATMEWDDELAARAVLNVKQCEMKHDQCRKTEKYKKAGQNLKMSMTSKEAESSPEHIAKMASGWFDNEQKNGKKYGWMKMIKEFPSNRNKSYGVGHFTQFIWATAHKIGCAVSTFKTKRDGKKWNATLLACNYNFGNMHGEPVYIAGPATSKCASGKNKKYEGLCSTKEKYDV